MANSSGVMSSMSLVVIKICGIMKTSFQVGIRERYDAAVWV